MITFSYIFYNFFFIVLSIFALPFSLLKIFGFKGSLHGERWGFYPREFLTKIGKRPVIWLHAASVGEVRVALTLLAEMKMAYCRHGFVVSTTTPQGREIASRADEVDAALLAPLDLPWLVRRALKLINPRLFMVAETELWPNLLREVKNAGTAAILFNGRISRRSYRFYRPLRFFFKGVLKNFDALCVKSSADKERLMNLGAVPHSMHVTGDIKFHMIATPDEAEKKRLRQELRLPHNAPVMIAGSTHEGEEELILETFQMLKVDIPRLILILAPRHLQRISRVEGLLESLGFRWVKKTMIDERRRPEEIILLDTVGELASIYGLGTAIFVGGSFAKIGGHNILEVLAHGKGVIFGPHVENIADVARLVVQKGAGVQATTAGELRETLRRLIVDASYRERMGERGISFLREHQGALSKTMRIVRTLYKG